MGKGREAVEVEDRKRGIGYRLAEEGPGAVIEEGEDLLIAHRWIDDPGLYPHPFHRDEEEVRRASIQIAHHDEVVAG